MCLTCSRLVTCQVYLEKEPEGSPSFFTNAELHRQKQEMYVFTQFKPLRSENYATSASLSWDARPVKLSMYQQANFFTDSFSHNISNLNRLHLRTSILKHSNRFPTEFKPGIRLGHSNTSFISEIQLKR